MWFSTLPCNDENKEIGDGCTPFCQIEPICVNGAGCTSVCGDGLIIHPEECDDGNNISGDGCSSDCKVEPGYTCSQPPLGDTITVPLIVKDFLESHPDFQPSGAGQCGGTVSSGMVQNQLATSTTSTQTKGKPVLQQAPAYSGCNTASSAANFADWYNHNTGGNAVLVSTMTQYRNESGDYVNRWGANGERWRASTGSQTLGCAKTLPYHAEIAMCTPDWGECNTNVCADSVADYAAKVAAGWTCHKPCPNGHWGMCMASPAISYNPPCSACEINLPQYDPADGWTCNPNCGSQHIDGPNGWGNYQVCATRSSFNYYDGNPAFFPADGAGITPTNEYYTASIADDVYHGGWQSESSKVQEAGLPPLANYYHNFHFTTEVRFWFEYDSTATQVLEFVGDDDVWVFINGQLALDIGGIHAPVQNSDNVETLRLTHGKVYEIVVFQAERQTSGSSYKLTLSGFNTHPSVCVPTCGDGIVTIGEQCDDGINAGGYGNCGPGCVLGEYCGDGVLNGPEECDNGVNLDMYGSADPDACAPNCLLPPRCGDGLVQSEFGETCDDGINDGRYGGCTASCQMAPRCGDAILNGMPGYPEECDDGVNAGGYNRCAPGCVLGPRCGDGIIQAEWGEQCDGTNVPDGRQCDANCRLVEQCGNGQVDPGEECDFGVAGNDGTYGGCMPNCRWAPKCGDGIVQTGFEEECDNGVNSGD